MSGSLQPCKVCKYLGPTVPVEYFHIPNYGCPECGRRVVLRAVPVEEPKSEAKKSRDSKTQAAFLVGQNKRKK